MPVVGSSAYNTAGQITSLVRSLLNDAQGNLFTDTVLLPYLNSAYRKVQRAIGNAGGGGFIQDDALLVVAAVAGRGALPGWFGGGWAWPPHHAAARALGAGWARGPPHWSVARICHSGCVCV